MRLMSYRLELTSDNGYVISNTAPDLSGTTTTHAQVKAPGIKMNILNLPNACKDDFDSAKSGYDLNREEFLSQFNFEENNWGNPEFRECYRHVICGEKTNWKLTSVQVAFGYLWLEFASEKRYQEIAEEGNVEDDSPYYSEGVSFTPSECGSGMFRFEIERPDGLIETYKVSISRNNTRIEEQVGDQKRTIRYDRENGEKSQWVTIEWYC